MKAQHQALVTARVPRRLKKLVQREARQRGISESVVIRWALERRYEPSTSAALPLTTEATP